MLRKVFPAQSLLASDLDLFRGQESMFITLNLLILICLFFQRNTIFLICQVGSERRSKSLVVTWASLQAETVCSLQL